jgi:hypothetical protein
MHGARSRRVVVVLALVLAGCHGGGSKSSGSSAGTVDTKSACAALANLKQSGAALAGVDIADPTASTTALAKAIRDYSAALLIFERVGPADLRTHAAAVRAAVVARHFGQAAVARAAIDAWAVQHCA